MPGVDLALLASWVVAVVAILGLLLREYQRRGESIESRIERAVEAKIGGVLLNFRAVESEVQARLSAALADQRAAETALKSALNEASGAEATIGSLVQRAEALVPTVEVLEAAPRMLVYRARSATSPGEVASALARLLGHPSADPASLEAGGDLARDRLGDEPLALRLYRAAVDRDPTAVSARAELLRLEATTSGKGEEARDQLVELARAHPGVRTVIGRLLDVLTFLSDHSANIRIADELLEGSEYRSYLLRNKAIAQSHLGVDQDGVVSTFEESLQAARAKASEDEIFNATVPYASYLLDIGRVDTAERILLDAFRAAPLESILHLLYARSRRMRDDLDGAARSLERAVDLGNPDERERAAEELKKVAYLRDLMKELPELTTTA